MRISTSADFPTVSIQNGRRDLLSQFHRECLVEQGEEWFRPWRRHIGRRQKVDHKAELFLRDQPELLKVAVLRIAAIDLDQRRDVGDDAGGQFLRHQVPVPLHEHEGDDRLQDHHRRDDDQQRAGIEARRHDALGEEPDAVPGDADAIDGAAQGIPTEVEGGHGVTTSL